MRGLAGVALLAVSCCALVACGKADAPVDPRPTATPTLGGSSRADGVEVVDMASRTVKVPRPVERVVALSPSAQEFAAVFELDVVGRTSDAGGNPASGAAVVGSTNRPDFAVIAGLKPDLVFGDLSLQGALRRDFDQFPYPVFLIKVASYEDVLRALRAMGEATDRKERAEELVAEVEQRVAAARDSVAGKAQPRVLILTGSGRDVYAGSDESYIGSLVKLLGAQNVAGSAPQGAPIAGYGLVEVEQAASLNPDVVLVVGGAQSDLKAQIEASAGWATTRAVRDGRVVVLDAGPYLRSPGPQVAAAVEDLARVLYR